MKPGIYRVYKVHAGYGHPLEQLLGRFLIKNGQIFVLEDYEDILSDSIIDGQMESIYEKFFWSLTHSPYYKVVHESETNTGMHDNIPELDIGTMAKAESHTDYGKNYLAFSNLLAKDEEPTKDFHYFDAAIPQVYNKLAFGHYPTNNKHRGIFLAFKLNSLTQINQVNGHGFGDNVIKNVFKTIADLCNQNNFKCFRISGNRGLIHMNDRNEAHSFADTIKDEIEKIPAQANHKPSISVGIGFSPEHATKSMEQAGSYLKNGDGSKKYQLGTEPTSVSSGLHERPPSGWSSFVEPSGLPKYTEKLNQFGLKPKNPLE